jgi:hypothetical protein
MKSFQEFVVEKQSTRTSLIDLDVQVGDKIKFAHSYSSSGPFWIEADVTGFTKKGKVEVKAKNGQKYDLDWSHEAKYA